VRLDSTSETPRPPGQLARAITPRLEPIVRKSWPRSPEGRYATAQTGRRPRGLADGADPRTPPRPDGASGRLDTVGRDSRTVGRTTVVIIYFDPAGVQAL